MDCPQCRRECGQNDKFCSECGYRLCSARTPVTELSVPGKETGDSTDVSSADLSRVRRNSIDWTRPNLDLQPRTECTVTVSTAMEEELLSNATPKTSNRKPSAPVRVEATDVMSRSVTLCWERPVCMEGVSHEIHITYDCEGEEPRLQICAPNITTAVLTDLRPGMEYTFNNNCSKTSSTCIQRRKKITMATSSQIPEVTKGLTTAAECWEDTKLLMQPYANWEEYLTPAPMSIAILAELVFISSNTDFSIRKGGPEGGFKYIKYPDSFRACLMQVCNYGSGAFNDAHKNMDQIHLYTNCLLNYIKMAVQILLQDDDNLVQAMLPGQLDNISNIADECVNLAQSTEKRFTDVIELIQELLGTCTSARQVYGNELEEVRKKISENELRKKAAEEATSHAEQAYKNMNQQLKEAQESFKSAMDSMPSGWEMIGMNFVEGLSGKPPQITKMQENSSGHRSAGQMTLDNACLRIEQNRVLFEKARESYDKHEKDKPLTEILVMRKERDFSTTIKILAQGLEAMVNVKDQWQKLMCYFRMISNLMKTSLTEFVKTGERASNKTFKYTSRMFLKDMICSQAFCASSIASQVNIITETYTEVSDKYLMDGFSRLSKLMSLDVSKPEFLSEQEHMADSCKEAEEGIRNLVKSNKENFERKTMQRLKKVESQLKVVLPSESEEKKRERKEVVENAYKNDQDIDQYS